MDVNFASTRYEALLKEFETRFNQTMELSKFTKEELEDYANKIRTKKDYNATKTKTWFQF